MNERVVVERDGHVAKVMLNRPQKYNAVDRAMFEAFAGDRPRVGGRTGRCERWC